MDDRARFESSRGSPPSSVIRARLDLDTLEIPALLERISAEDHTVPGGVAASCRTSHARSS